MPREREWPPSAPSPSALTLAPDGLLNSDRSCVARGRRGTAGSVGPSALSPGGRYASDFGQDRVSPRRFDPMGTPDQRAPPFPESRRVQR